MYEELRSMGKESSFIWPKDGYFYNIYSSKPFHIETNKLIEHRGEDSVWSEPVLFTDSSTVAIKADMPGGLGGSADDHVHYDFVEWWIILKGKLEFQIGNYEPFVASTNDIVSAPIGLRHLIISSANEQSVRLIIGVPGGSGHDNKKLKGSQDELLPKRNNPPNLIHNEMQETIKKFGNSCWSKTILKNQHTQAQLISETPDSINSSRYKDPFNQWYIVIQGNIHFSFEKNDDINAVEGDIVYIPKDLTYNINSLGSKTSLRMSISKPR
jgi:mannose-6-phosphate isomerase-like protein (cupin superfamily)